jgi:hypothetical protein
VTLIAAALALLAALLQVSFVPMLWSEPLGAPVLPVAAVAAWTAARGPRELWPALVLAPVLLGTASVERVGWFLLALLPAATAPAALRAHDESRFVTLAGRCMLAAAAAGFGAAFHSTLLTIAGGQATTLAAAVGTLGAGAIWTAALALLIAAALPVSRTRAAAGLFA